MGNGEAERVSAGPVGAPDGVEQPVTPEPAGRDDTPADAPAPRGGCRSDRQGWAGAHLHGAVRPRRRPVGRGRPPGRWC